MTIKMKNLASIFLLSTLALAACGGDTDGADSTPSSSSSSGAGGAGGAGGDGGQPSASSSSSQASGSGGTGGGGGSGGAGGAEACLSGSDPRPEDAPRLVIVGHSGAATDTDYEVLSLTSDGTLSTTGQHFAMGSAGSAPIVFTPNGRMGFAPQKDGTLGVFYVKEDNAIEVLDAAFGKDQLYADSVLMAPAGDHFLVVDGNWANNGGGVYRVDIACNGALSVKGRIIDGKNPSALLWAGDSEVFVTARELGPVKSGESLHRLALTDPPTILGGVDLFGDDDAFISAMGQTRDGKHLFIGDNSQFSGIDNRVAFAKVAGNGFEVTGVSSDVEDPSGFAASPFNDRVIVTSGFGDGIFVFAYDDSSATPFTFQGQVAYPSGKPQIPGAPVMVGRGTLDGRVLIPEVRGVYQLQFKGGGVIENLGVTTTETAIVDNVGVQP